MCANKDIRDFKNYDELTQYFHNEETCEEYLEIARWGGKPTCIECGSEAVYKFQTKRKYGTKSGIVEKVITRFRCNNCKKQFSVRQGTIFEESKLPLRTWFLAIYLITNHKKGISSVQLADDLGVTQKTGWFLLHRIRKVLGIEERGEFEGENEIDETYVNGKEKNKHKSKRTKGTQGRSLKTKNAVLGIANRETKTIRAKHVVDTKSKTIIPEMQKHVKEGSTVYTDEYKAYLPLKRVYDHKIVKHSHGEYVRDLVHVNHVEGFWSLFKRGILGIYHSTSEKHLQKYVDEFVFRYNNRTIDSRDRFRLMLTNVAVGHLSYQELIAQYGKEEGKETQGNTGEQGKLDF